jgi:hypothetical protein
VHWYGKAEVAPGRKVGHVTIVAPSAAEARRRLAAISPDAALALASTSGGFPSHQPMLMLCPRTCIATRQVSVQDQCMIFFPFFLTACCVRRFLQCFI